MRLSPQHHWRKAKHLMQSRPWLGWYIALIVTLDFLIHLIESHSL